MNLQSYSERHGPLKLAYGLGDTVRVDAPPPKTRLPNNTGLLGIVTAIDVVERIAVREDAEPSYERSVLYHVRLSCSAQGTYREENLLSAERVLHPDAFQVQEGQIIRRENALYVVESAAWETTDFSGWPSYAYTREWKVIARALVDGAYDPSAPAIEFLQEPDDALDIVGELRKRVMFGP